MYKFLDSEGKEITVSFGNDDTAECDIYWEDIVAEKNNKKETINADGTSVLIGGFDPVNATDITNKSCPFCGGDVDRFYFIGNKKRGIEDSGWMEACFNCKKPIRWE